MTERYFKKTYGDEYYIFDSETITEKEFEEKFDYEDYRAFEDSMMGDEVVNRLNEQHTEIIELKAEFDQSLSVYEDVANAKYKHFKLKVNEVLQEAYQLSKQSFVYKPDNENDLYIGQAQRIAILRLLKKIAEELGVDLE